MNTDLEALLSELRQRRHFEAKEWIDKKVCLIVYSPMYSCTPQCNLLNDYMSKNGLSAAVVSMSGGIDSSCTLGILLKASKMPGSPLKKVSWSTLAKCAPSLTCL